MPSGSFIPRLRRAKGWFGFHQLTIAMLPPMKAFIDGLNCYYNCSAKNFLINSPASPAGQRRKAIIACIGEQPDKESSIGFNFDAMRLPIEALGYELIGKTAVLGTNNRLSIQKQALYKERVVVG